MVDEHIWEKVRETGKHMTAAWRKKTRDEFFKKHGHWYYFTGIQTRARKNWIERYKKEE
tara:strand:+ start:1169 stop:1345 length:177 start_codon:yes stop_codon:yes gene_type:complete